MRVVLAGNQERGLVCLRALVAAGHEIAAVLAHPVETARGGVAEEGARLDVPVLRPTDVNDSSVAKDLVALTPDALVLVGYGQILREPLIDLFPRGCINLHGGRLPHYRGSSPMNWALINGDSEITLSAILVDSGVDTGDIVGERVFAVGLDQTIADVQARANELFPELLVEVLSRVEKSSVERRSQNESEAAYWPLRFPDDGLVVWDQLSARQVHDRVRALAPPYPGALTVWRGRRVKLLRSALEPRVVRGEPGRIYAVGAKGVLVCAADRCLRITEAIVEDDGSQLSEVASRYDELATLRKSLLPAM